MAPAPSVIGVRARTSDPSIPRGRARSSGGPGAGAAPARPDTATSCRAGDILTAPRHVRSSDLGPGRLARDPASRRRALGALRAHLPLAVVGDAVDRAPDHVDPFALHRRFGVRLDHGQTGQDPPTPTGDVAPPVGMDRAPRSSVMTPATIDRHSRSSVLTPVAIDPHVAGRLRLPVTRDPDEASRRDSPVTRDPHVGPRGRLPVVGARHPDVARTGLRRHGFPAPTSEDLRGRSELSTFAELFRAPGLAGDQALRSPVAASSGSQRGARHVPSESTVSHLPESGNHPRNQRECAWVQRHPVVRTPSCRASGAC
jgi:hypothetical protein